MARVIGYSLLALSVIWAVMARGWAGEVVAAQALSKGTVLEPSMLVATANPKDLEPLLGQQLRRPIYEAKPVRLVDVKPVDLVTRQETVTVQFRRRGLVLTLPGRAMRSGGAGDPIPVMLDGRRQPITATVVAQNLVEIR